MAGFGNWSAVADHVGTKSQDQCKVIALAASLVPASIIHFISCTNCLDCQGQFLGSRWSFQPAWVELSAGLSVGVDCGTSCHKSSADAYLQPVHSARPLQTWHS